MPALRIVCIEDDSEIVDLIRLILAAQGFQIVGAAGGQEGLTLVQAQKPDLILLDLMMPDMDGWEVYHRMREDPALADVPVIVVTARAQEVDRVLGLQIAHVDDYLTKPFTPKELLGSVERVLRARRLARPAEGS
ncbi:MAG: response regulator [Anaerolineales bacterium]|jgi:DNA-binding response OmpR family regulator